MKKFVFASVIALASLSLVSAHTLRAQEQNSGTIQIKDPAEFNAYQMATSQADPKAKAAAEKDFLTKYPNSVAKKAVLNDLLQTYQQLQDSAGIVETAKALLQVDPNDLAAIYFTVAVEKGQCAKSSDQATCDDMAALAQKGLQVTKPASMSDAEWKQRTDLAFPTFDSAIALDDLVSKKDPGAAVDEYKKELALPGDTTKGQGLVDSLQLAQAYVKLQLVDAQAARDADAKLKAAPTDASLAAASKAANDKANQDYIMACWLFARVWGFAPQSYKTQIEPQLEYYYKKYHGNLDGLDGVKSQAASALFPPAGFTITPAPTPQEQIHQILANTPDLKSLALTDKEMVLAVGAKEDADKLWSVVQGQETPVPGTVIESNANQVKVAVTEDAKSAKTADFIVNMKEPIPEKEIPAVGSELKLLKDGGPELDGTYDTYTQVPPSATAAASAQIVLKDGILQTKKAPVHKPAAGHRPVHRPQ